MFVQSQLDAQQQHITSQDTHMEMERQTWLKHQHDLQQEITTLRHDYDMLQQQMITIQQQLQTTQQQLTQAQAQTQTHTSTSTSTHWFASLKHH
jgi:chromosome segregation ATPase